MIKTIPTYPFPERKNNFRIMMDKFRSSESRENLQLDLWVKKATNSSSLENEFSNNTKRWNKFQNNFRNEFHEKIKLMEEIRETKIENRPVTWIYTPRFGYSKAAV